MKEAQRAPGSEWLKDHPNFLVGLSHFSKRLFERAYPVMARINPSWAGRSIVWAEELVKGWMFNCQMCGQCILHSTGMTCPMTCPKPGGVLREAARAALKSGRRIGVDAD